MDVILEKAPYRVYRKGNRILASRKTESSLQSVELIGDGLLKALTEMADWTSEVEKMISAKAEDLYRNVAL